MYFNNYFNYLSGTPELKKQIEQGLDAETISKSWEPGVNDFKKIREKYLLYNDFE